MAENIDAPQPYLRLYPDPGDVFEEPVARHLQISTANIP